MSDSTSLRDRYLALIDRIVETTLKGQIRSKEQVYQMLVQEIATGTGEVFEGCLAERLSSTEQQLKDRDEMKQAKATRIQRALKTVQGEWERWLKENRHASTLASTVQQILTAESRDRLAMILRIVDPNQESPFTLDRLQELAKVLHQHLLQTANPDAERDIQQIVAGIAQGLDSWQQVEGDIISWIYQERQLGFAGTSEQNGPWAVWAKKANSPFLKALFAAIANHQSIVEFISKQSDLGKATVIELAIVLQGLQRGLISWFDKQVYDSKLSAQASISTYLTFASIWCQLANGFHHALINSEVLANGCFQVTLQILRTFSQRDYFPLYGGIFASFSGSYLRNIFEYFDEPLRRVEGTQAKARILTLLGDSMRTAGQYERAMAFHQQALEIARKEGDRRCEIANLNHISRTYVAQKNYAEAINYSQRALILARQAGERQGEANALANLGYSEVFQARQLQQVEPEVYESAIHYLEQGLRLSERLGDAASGDRFASRQTQAFCFSSLGLAKMALQQPESAIEYLAKGWRDAQFSGDLYLQGLNLAYLSEAYYSTSDLEKAIFSAALGMYILEQIGSIEWRQPAALLTIMQGQIGTEKLQELLSKNRSNAIALIGVDGYDYLLELLNQYQQSL